MKIEYYNKRGKRIKTAIYGGFKEIKDIWTITKIMVETPRKGSKTLMQYDNVDYDIGLSDSLFEQSNLKRWGSEVRGQRSEVRGFHTVRPGTLSKSLSCVAI